MELWYATTSPFACKVRIAAAELGLDDQIALVRVDPWTDDSLRRRNPLCKVPSLVLDDGAVLFESTIICEWSDILAPGSGFSRIMGRTAGRRCACKASPTVR